MSAYRSVLENGLDIADIAREAIFNSYIASPVADYAKSALQLASWDRNVGGTILPA